MAALNQLKLKVRTTLRACAPWWLKGALRLALAKTPVSYTRLRWLGLAHHGGMERPDWAYTVFRTHYDSAEFHRKGDGFTVLELGPGDSLLMALIGAAHGATSSDHVDVGAFANTDPVLYQRAAHDLRARGLSPVDLSGAASLDDVLARCHATYRANGLASLRELRDASVDLTFSNSVLQHVRLAELDETLQHLRRVMHPQGCGVHSMDLRDMMGQSLHHLRFSQRRWDSAWFGKAGFYTNRLRLHEWLAAFARARFSVQVAEENRWEHLPIPRRRLAAPYRDLSDEQLLCATVRVVLRPT
jgi:hypothetical protein